ncbi:MAG: hypothetical protein PHP95_13175 [Desulfuromonadaceae bacterium]|nr:hypothetical protein [Desulfuromonadaceae bacterium]MDD2849397.1 hypothetical protein [Desulfuromonadaceae bacterium]MDD4130035.1 hypothetical protein [Desulfuromonadaceae bacterium]
MPSITPFLEVVCQQVMTEDASIFSVQWADMPVALTAQLSTDDLLCRYLCYVKKFTLGLIRPLTLEGGIEFRLVGTQLSLIKFLPAEHSDNFVTLRICGGVLVQPRQCDRGELRFGIEPTLESVRASLQLSDFCPLILGSNSPSPFRLWLYRVTQAALHRLVTVRFLALLYRELAGPYAQVRVKNIVVRPGRPV